MYGVKAHGGILLEGLSWPESLPYRDLFLFVKLSNSAIESVSFIPYFPMVFPVYSCSSPS